jgi:hypothetical protein
MSVAGGKAEDIYSQRAFRLLTRSGSHSQAVVQSGSPRFARAKVVRFLRMAYIPNSQHERECLYDDGRL